ncbi:MAG: ComEC/Rec2 family competence protein [Bryobacteraceae bacterium]
MRAVTIASLLLAGALSLLAARNLEIYSIDVEGGQATLFVAPGGDSMLVDTGFPDNNHRDSERIAAAAKAAGVKKIDYLVITHYHRDHVGGIFQLSQVLPIVHFVDHGPQSETGKDPEILFHEYLAAARKSERITVKPGDTIPVKGLDVKVLAANGEVIQSPLAGAGQPTPECQGFARPPADATENSHSIGMLIAYGDFRMLDMGDLTKDREYDLVCPNNLIGTVDLFLVSHHGTNPSNSLPFVHAISPRVALMNNGPHKGGNPEVWQTVRDTRGLIDFWQLHYAIDTDKEHNSADTFIANVDAHCEGKWIRVTAQKDGTFTVYNSRNKFEKTYTKR